MSLLAHCVEIRFVVVAVAAAAAAGAAFGR
jgi:hypothetical protein